MTPLLSAIADHLWQSTVFACVAGLLTLLLRKNRARVRYAVWMAASFKFLIPFAVLIALGSHIHLRTAAVAPQSPVYVVMDDVSQPFTTSAVSLPVKQVPPVRNLIPTILIAIWAVGFIGISLSWLIRWWRIRRAVRAGSPLTLEIPTRVVSSPTFVEPGVFGTVTPVLFLPEGISERLTPDQLKAVISHELCHVRYRDNLIAAIQMLVETVFWFHPMVWWMGKRMVDERERACDEDVVRMGSDPGVYAEGILKVCQFYLESPVACVSGITGSDLKKRMERILKNQPGEMLCNWRKLFLVITGVTALAVPVIAGVLSAQALQTVPSAQTDRPAFEVVSVKPLPPGDRKVGGGFQPGGRFVSVGPLLGLISFAYNLPGFGNPSARLTGVPDWVRSRDSAYAIEATGVFPDGLSEEARKDRERLMLQALLADRFKLVIHREVKELPVYALVAAKGGPKLQKADIEEKDCPDLYATPAPDPKTLCHTLLGGGGRGFYARAVSISELANGFENYTGDRPLVDKTGIEGLYHIETTPFLPMQVVPSLAPRAKAEDGTPLEDVPIISEVFERLGLRLEPEKDNVDVYVIDHVEKPTDNASAQAAAPELGAQSAGQGPSAQSQAAPTERLAFDAVSVKPSHGADLRYVNVRTGSALMFQPGGRFVGTNVPLRSLIRAAYHLSVGQGRGTIVGVPGWADSEQYDVEAKAEGNPSTEQLMLMLQSLLANRFKLVVHWETREMPVYALVMAKPGKTGPQLVPHAADNSTCQVGPISTPAPLQPGAAPPRMPAPCGGGFFGPPGRFSTESTMEGLAKNLSWYQQIDRAVVDKTGLGGTFDISVDYVPFAADAGAPGGDAGAADPSLPSTIFMALQEQLGLKLDSTTGPVDVLVIDHVEEPTPN